MSARTDAFARPGPMGTVLLRAAYTYGFLGDSPMNYGNAKVLRRHPLGAALIAALLIPGAAFAQDAASGSQEGETTNLGKVQVIGSRIKRSEIEGPSPVTVITAEQIKQEGFDVPPLSVAGPFRVRG